MSAFEVACWNWSQDYVNQFTLESGTLAELIREERLRGTAKKFFIRALSLICETFERVAIEKHKRAAGG